MSDVAAELCSRCGLTNRGRRVAGVSPDAICREWDGCVLPVHLGDPAWKRCTKCGWAFKLADAFDEAWCNSCTNWGVW